MTHRFYCPELPSAGTVTLQGDEAHHLARVRRVGLGEEVELFDGRSPDAQRAFVRAIRGDRVELELVGSPVGGREPRRELTLATACPKGDRLDWLVEKAVEVGVSRWVPLITRRTVVEPGPRKLGRLRRAIVEASKQCGRNRLMAISAPVAWNHLLQETSPGTRLIADPGGTPPRRWSALAPVTPLTLAVGPEGGFLHQELAEAQSRGWTAVALGPTNFRIETAAIVGAALVMALCDPERNYA